MLHECHSNNSQLRHAAPPAPQQLQKAFCFSLRDGDSQRWSQDTLELGP